MFAFVPFSDWQVGVGFVVTVGGFVFTLYKFLDERAQKREERRKREKAEAELKDVMRRAHGPDFRVTYLHVPQHEGRPNQILHRGQAVDPAKVSAGIQIVVDLANDGAPVRHVDDDWQKGEGVGTLPAGVLCGETSGASLVYRFDPAQLGKPKNITVTFDTENGLKLSQVYETRHGWCEIKRIDPL